MGDIAGQLITKILLPCLPGEEVTDISYDVLGNILTMTNDVINDPSIRDRQGDPNRWPMPESVHKDIHKGAVGGEYNIDWKKKINNLEGKPMVKDVLKIKKKIIKKFNLEQFRP